MPTRIASIAMLLALGGIATLVALSFLVITGTTAGFDQAIIAVVRSPDLHGPLSPLRAITELGSTLAVALVAPVAIAVGVAIGPWIHGVIGAAVIALASLANSGLKVLIARERPEVLEPILVERGFSFPSGHSTLGMTAWGILAVLVSRSRLPLAWRRGIVAILGVLIGLIGVSRIWLGVHYPTDVIAGWIAGGTIVLVYAELTRAVSMEPAEAAVDVDPAAPRSDPPATA